LRDDDRNRGARISSHEADAADLELILEAGEQAGRIAMSHFRKDPEVWFKNEGTSPVSAADIAVDRFLKDALLGGRPDFGWLSEETVDASDRLTHDSVFVVDPIDGTRAFVEGLDVWCVSIAVVRRGIPVAGVLVAPALGEVFSAGSAGPALKNGVPLTSRIVGSADGAGGEPMRFAAPQNLIAGVAQHFGRAVTRMPHVPSLAYRLAMVADGRLDATLVKPRARDWDIAAADLILKRAGGVVMSLDAREIIYNRAETDHGILVAAGDALMPRLARVVAGLQGSAPLPASGPAPASREH
jgi:myo-inositol-1(or 4)-monophosphatase